MGGQESQSVITVEDAMNRNVVTVDVETPFDEIVRIMSEHDFNGLPVLGKSGKLLGVITKNELATKDGGIHIPTLIKTFNEIEAFKQEKWLLDEVLSPLRKLIARDIMNSQPLFMYAIEPLAKAVVLFAEHHKLNPLIIIDSERKVVGVLSRHDLLKILAEKNLGEMLRPAKEYAEERRAEGAIRGAMGEVKKFVLVSKSRTKWWLIISILFAVVGFVIAFAFILR